MLALYPVRSLAFHGAVQRFSAETSTELSRVIRRKPVRTLTEKGRQYIEIMRSEGVPGFYSTSVVTPTFCGLLEKDAWRTMRPTPSPFCLTVA